MRMHSVVVAADPFIGTWKLNLAKSKLSPALAVKSEIYRKTFEKGMFKLEFEGIHADGKPYHIESTFKYDGKEYPVRGDSFVDAIVPKRVSPTTFLEIAKKGGKQVGTAEDVFSTDGKTCTRTIKLKDTQGKESTSIAVYDKQ